MIFFSGLWLDKTALLIGNSMKVIEVVKQGLATVEHQNFVDNLSKKEGIGNKK